MVGPPRFDHQPKRGKDWSRLFLSGHSHNMLMPAEFPIDHKHSLRSRNLPMTSRL
jgi:hypothetical protein